MGLSNVRPPKVLVTLDQERELKFGMFAIAYIDEKYTVTNPETNETTGGYLETTKRFWEIVISKKWNMENLRILADYLYASLLEDDPELLPDDIIPFIKGGNFARILNAIVLALRSDNPAPKEGADDAGFQKSGTPQ